MTYPPFQQPDHPRPMFPSAPPYQQYPQEQYAGYGQPFPGQYQPPPGPQFLPPEAPLHYARFDPVQPVRVLAGPGRRLGARLIDVVIMWVVLAAAAGLAAGLTYLINPKATSIDGPAGVAIIVLAVAGWLLYEPLFNTLKGGTPGKLWLGIRIVRTADGAKPGFGAALGRFLFPFVLIVVPFGGLLNPMWLLWDRPLYQCLHDKVASTVVVRREGGQPGVIHQEMPHW